MSQGRGTGSGERGPTGDGRAAVLTAGAVAAAMIAQQVAGKAARDALFLSHYPAQQLPKAMIASALLSLITVGLVSRAITRLGPARLVPVVFVLNAGLFGLEQHLLASRPAMVAWLVYLHIGALGATVTSGFWSVVNERFDPHAAKRAIARIGAAATFGGLVGGLGAERLAELVDLRTMLLILAGISTACAVGLLKIGAPDGAEARAAEREEPVSGLQVLRETPYVRNLGMLVALMAVTEALLDYAFKAQASVDIAGQTELLRFFAVFHAGVSLATFLLQTLLARRALTRLGVDGTVALLPAGALLCSVLGVAIPRLWSTVLARGVQMVLGNSLFRSGYEVLFTPLTPGKKRSTKVIIDVAFERLGDASGAAIVLGVLALVPGTGVRVVLAVAAVTAGAALWVSQRLQRGYVGALADSLRSGAVDLAFDEELDATTLHTLNLASTGMKREQLLAQLDGLRASRPSVPPDPPPDSGDVLDAVRDLTSGTSERIARALRERRDPRLVPFIVPLLRRDDLRSDVVAALRELGPRCVGQLVDALLDPDEPFVVRRRLPEVLEGLDDPRAVRGLFAGLSDERFEVRYRCGHALSEIALRGTELHLSRQQVLDAAARELEASDKAWKSQALLEEQDPGPSWLDQAVRRRLHRRLEHVFTVLSLTLEREPLHLSLHALYGNDDSMRGTALEYLESVLPASIRDKLWPFLGAGRPTKRPRPARDLARELMATYVKKTK